MYSSFFMLSYKTIGCDKYRSSTLKVVLLCVDSLSRSLYLSFSRYHSVSLSLSLGYGTRDRFIQY